MQLNLIDQIRGFIRHMGLGSAKLSAFGRAQDKGRDRARQRALYRKVVMSSAETPEAWAALPIEERLRLRKAAEAVADQGVAQGRQEREEVEPGLGRDGFEIFITDHGRWPSLEQTRTARQQALEQGGEGVEAVEEAVGAGERVMVIIVPLDVARGQSGSEKSWVLAGDPGLTYKTSPGPDTNLMVRLTVWQEKAETQAARQRMKESREREKEKKAGERAKKLAAKKSGNTDREKW